MSLVIQLLAVAAVIAILIVLRVVSDRHVMRQRLAGRSGQDCKETECFGSCGGERPDEDRPRT